MFAAAALCALVCAAPHPAAGSDPYREVSLALGEGLVSLFPAAEGYVVSADGGEAYVDLALKDLLKPGMELQIYRPGEQMVHPVTRQVLGSYEKNLGVLSLTDVREKYSRGSLDPAGAAAGVVAGDRVRLSARRLRTLLHVSGAAGGVAIGPLAQALIARGEQSGRFAMIDEPAWAPFLGALAAPWESVRVDPARLRRLGELAAADLLLLARIEAGPPARVDLEVRSLLTGTTLGDLSERWPAPAPPAVPAQAAAPAAPAAAVAVAPAVVPAPVLAPVAANTPGEYRVLDLATPARCLATGNVLGEGALDVVLSDGARLSLFRWESDALAWKWDEDGRGGRRILSLDAADVDGDGRSEVLVTSVARGRVTTELRRWSEGALKVAAAIDGVYLRAAPRPGAPALLLGQHSGVGEVLAGRVEQYRLSDGGLERVEGTALSGKVGIFGLALAPPGGPAQLFSLDRTGALFALDGDGAVLWRSQGPYGGYPPPLPAHELFGPGVFDEQDFVEEARAFQGRLLAGPAPGGARVVVPRNFSDSPVSLTRQRTRGQGEIVVFDGLPSSPAEPRRSRPFEGYVADLASADVDGDGAGEILFVVNRVAGLLQGERGRLVVWRRPAVAGGGGK